MKKLSPLAFVLSFPLKNREIVYIVLALFFCVHVNAQQIPNGNFDADWVECYPWEKGTHVTTAYGTQPEGWCVSNIPNSLMPVVAELEIKGDSNRVIKISNVSVAGITAPGFITLGTTWATCESKLTTVRNQDGGVFGGIPFTYHPDAIQLQYKHDISNGEENMVVIAYLWKGEWVQDSVPSNMSIGTFSYGTAEKVTMIDRDCNILGKSCLTGGEITQSDDAELIASAEKYIAEPANEWTLLTVDLDYGEYAGQLVDVEKFNIVISASNYFEDYSNVVSGNYVCVDDVKLIYYHALSSLSYEGQNVQFEEDRNYYDLSSVIYNANKLSYSKKGQGANVVTQFDDDTRILTIRVESEDIADNPDSYTEYKIQFGGVIDSKTISENVILTAESELKSVRDVNVVSGVELTTGQDFSETLIMNNLSIDANLFSGSYAQILSTTDNIIINGDLSERIYTQGVTWNFLSLPFDCDLSRMATEDGTAYAIRYYDGASRAANNVAVGNWKNFGKNDIIPMGTGFIYMTEHDTWTQFYAVDNENKNQVFRSTSSSTTLGMQQNEAREAAHSGWNLLGNPYANYYSIHATDFDKAVTYWNGETGTYDVCYPSDDDLALKPNQAFFVQCPSGRESITMPGSGRQLTGEISSGAKARRAQLNVGKERKLINLSLSDSQFTDKTRVVLNEEAKMEYELECDASKFMSMRSEVPQLYSIGPKSIHYAVNERPLDDGTVKLGVYIPADGDYAINLTRNDAEQVLLTDATTGTTTDLSEGSYSFFAKKGTYNNRLTLTFGTATGIQSPPTPKGGVPCGGEYYDLSGRRIGQPVKAGGYLLKQGKMVKKVMVK